MPLPLPHLHRQVRKASWAASLNPVAAGRSRGCRIFTASARKHQWVASLARLLHFGPSAPNSWGAPLGGLVAAACHRQSFPARRSLLIGIAGRFPPPTRAEGQAPFSLPKRRFPRRSQPRPEPERRRRQAQRQGIRSSLLPATFLLSSVPEPPFSRSRTGRPWSPAQNRIARSSAAGTPCCSHRCRGSSRRSSRIGSRRS